MPPPGFEPGSMAPQARILSKLNYRGIINNKDFKSLGFINIA